MKTVIFNLTNKQKGAMMEIIETSLKELKEIIKAKINSFIMMGMETELEPGDLSIVQLSVDFKEFPSSGKNGRTFVLNNSVADIGKKLQKLLKESQNFVLLEVREILDAQKSEERTVYIIKENIDDDTLTEITRKISMLSKDGIFDFIKASEMVRGLLLS